MINIFSTEDQLAIEFAGRGTNTGPLPLPTGDIPATGRYSESKFCEIIQLQKGKVASFYI